MKTIRSSFIKPSGIKVMFFSLLFFAGFTFVNAQEKGTMEVYVGIGGASTNAFGEALDDAFDIFETIFGTGDQLERVTGPILGTFRYAVDNRLMFGVTLAYERTRSRKMSGYVEVGKIYRTYHTVGVEGDYRWVSRESLQMYSGLGGGFTFGKEDFRSASTDHTSERESIQSFAFHVTGVGARFGKKVAVHTELGFGYKGFLNAGLSVQLR